MVLWRKCKGDTARRAVRRRTMTQKTVDWNAKRTVAYPKTVSDPPIHDTYLLTKLPFKSICIKLRTSRAVHVT